MEQNQSTLRKLDLWLNLCGELQSRLGRRLARDEIIAAGFILDERFYAIRNQQNLLRELFEIAPDDQPAMLNFKFHAQLKRSLDHKYTEAYTGNFGEEPDWWKALRNERFQTLLELNQQVFQFAEAAYELREKSVPLVGVPGYVVPQWIWQHLYLFDEHF